MRLSTRITIVAFTLGSCFLAAFLRLQEASESSHSSPVELFETVQSQILALRSQHYQQAYQQASSQYMDRGGLEAYIEAARGDSSTVRQALRWEFGLVTEGEFETDIQVRFFMPDGQSLQAKYTLVRENSIWKIDRASFPPPTPPRSLKGIRL
jgi:hypothetical protein